MAMTNLDERTVSDFGQEWEYFDQSALSPEELEQIFAAYFHIFPWKALPAGAVGFDLGCGSGRWARCVAPRVGRLHCIDASAAAVAVAQRNLARQPNCLFHVASVDHLPIADESMDFGYSLGVLHHVPNTLAGIQSCVAKLRPGAPFLIYLYYAFDNRPLWYRMLWQVSDIVRRLLCKLPGSAKLGITAVIATLVYWPLARCGLLLEKLGVSAEALPLWTYRHRSLYTMRTDALDRFGTRLELRFRADQIKQMLHDAGLERVTFSPYPPYWCALGYKNACAASPESSI